MKVFECVQPLIWLWRIIVLFED